MTDSFQQNKSTVSGSYAQMHDQARLRMIWVVMLILLGYIAVSLRLLDLAVLHRPDTVVAEKAAVKVAPIARLRGSVTDRNGTLMAVSLKMSSVFVNPSMVDEPEALAKQLAGILSDLSYKEALKKLTSKKTFVWIHRDITPKQQYAINALGNPALGFQEEDRRIYPTGNLTAHIVGYTDVDGKGIAGVEKFFQKQLTTAEKPVQLSIDLRVQHILHEELERSMKKFHASGAMGMIMDVRTGEIVAMVSLPDYDPNHIKKSTDKQRFNKATLGVFEMGSTFKIFSTAAALDSGTVSFSSVFDATDPIKIGHHKISDFHPERRALTVPEIFLHSSNIGTSKMAAAMGTKRIQEFYKKMGFLEQSKIELPERSAPLYPKPWREIDTMTTSFGHGIAVSPLHLVRAGSALMNGGVMYPATLMKRDAPPEGVRVVSAKTSQRMRQLLELVVVRGTGNQANAEGYNVGGKTGTAEKNISGAYNRNLLMSSFMGGFPMQAPRYAVLAIIDEPKGVPESYGYATGGWTAAPVVARVVERMAPLYRMVPNNERTKEKIDSEMGIYIKDLKEGNGNAVVGNDH